MLEIFSTFSSRSLWKCCQIALSRKYRGTTHCASSSFSSPPSTFPLFLLPAAACSCCISLVDAIFDLSIYQQVRLLIVAPNVDALGGAGGLDDKVVEMIDMAREGGTPVVFALSK